MSVFSTCVSCVILVSLEIGAVRYHRGAQNTSMTRENYKIYKLFYVLYHKTKVAKKHKGRAEMMDTYLYKS